MYYHNTNVLIQIQIQIRIIHNTRSRFHVWSYYLFAIQWQSGNFEQTRRFGGDAMRRPFPVTSNKAYKQLYK